MEIVQSKELKSTKVLWIHGVLKMVKDVIWDKFKGKVGK